MERCNILPEAPVSDDLALRKDDAGSRVSSWMLAWSSWLVVMRVIRCCFGIPFALSPLGSGRDFFPPAGGNGRPAPFPAPGL